MHKNKQMMVVLLFWLYLKKYLGTKEVVKCLDIFVFIYSQQTQERFNDGSKVYNAHVPYMYILVFSPHGARSLSFYRRFCFLTGFSWHFLIGNDPKTTRSMTPNLSRKFFAAKFLLKKSSKPKYTFGFWNRSTVLVRFKCRFHFTTVHFVCIFEISLKIWCEYVHAAQEEQLLIAILDLKNFIHVQFVLFSHVVHVVSHFLLPVQHLLLVAFEDVLLVVLN